MGEVHVNSGGGGQGGKKATAVWAVPSLGPPKQRVPLELLVTYQYISAWRYPFQSRRALPKFHRFGFLCLGSCSASACCEIAVCCPPSLRISGLGAAPAAPPPPAGLGSIQQQHGRQVSGGRVAAFVPASP
jgi:hypothetical protein